MENLTTDKYIETTKGFSNLIAEQGISNVNSAVLITAFVVLFVSFIAIFFMLLKSMERNQTEQLAQQKEFTNNVLARFEGGFDKLDGSIIELGKVINSGKSFSREDFTSIGTVATTNTILWIYIKISLIIDRNNLIKNEDSVLIEIKNTVEEFIQDGRDVLNSIKFDERYQTEFYNKTEIIKTEAWKNFRDLFSTSIHKLNNIQQLIEKHKEFIHQLENLTSHDVITHIEEYEKLKNIEHDEYNNLKRQSYSICKDTITTIKKLLAFC